MFVLKIPRRTLIIAGPQRAGKTTALAAILEKFSKEKHRIVLFTHRTVEAKNFLDSTDIDKNYVEVVGLTANKSKALDENKSYDIAVFFGSYIYQAPGHVQSYVKPSSFVQNWLEDLHTKKARFVYVEAHFAGTENDVLDEIRKVQAEADPSV